jgi:Fur family peroxide stress response transcriptional regulator
MVFSPQSKAALDEALAREGLRSTRQREHVFGVLLEERDHPSADEVYTRVKSGMPGISLATVYNCLETLVQCGLVRQVNHERESTRYCPNLSQHAHFHDKSTGRVLDIDLPPTVLDELRRILPAGFQAENIEISFHGSSARKPGRKSA